MEKIQNFMHWKMCYNRGFVRILTKFPSWFDAYYSRVEEWKINKKQKHQQEFQLQVLDARKF